MRQIVIIFFTFSGICTGFAQKPAEIIDPIMVKEKPAIRLFPNPAKNKVEIEIKGFDPGYLWVQLIDKYGNILRKERRLAFSCNEIIVFMFSEKPGLYFLLLKQGEKKVKSKLLIQ